MEIGSKLTIEYEVKEHDLAKHLAISQEDNFPEVLATSRMIALMELAAARLMKPKLSPQELSVGVNVNVNHTAATLEKEIVKATAEFTGMEGKFYAFTVKLYDSGGLAGTGTHKRAIIETQRLLEGAAKRIKN